jgi:hypothetical protein
MTQQDKNDALNHIECLLLGEDSYSPDEAQASLDTIRAALSRSAWQGIETAPKDGTKILITNGSWVHKARWSEDCQLGKFETMAAWQIFECEDAFYSVAALPNEVTKWQPLPAPPADKGE